MPWILKSIKYKENIKTVHIQPDKHIVIEYPESLIRSIYPFILISDSFINIKQP